MLFCIFFNRWCQQLFHFTDLQWTSPELLHKYYADLKHTRYRYDVGTQAADIYSVGIIMKEVFARNDPYTEYEDMELKGIILVWCHRDCQILIT